MVSLVQTNKQGQSLGRKGHATRRKLMDAAERLLEAHSPVELTVVAIAKEAETSSATYYMYFKDVKEVLYALSEIAGQEILQVNSLMEKPWEIDRLEAHATRLVKGYDAVWNRHRKILQYRNMEADRGDPAFEALRMNSYLPLIERMAKEILALSPEKGGPTLGEAYALASVLHASIERLAATDPELVKHAAGVKRLVAAQARVIAEVIRSTTKQWKALPKG
jgi:AcrR family transcriptional regulator